jgi:polyisoprenyl-phosphate glycosyltransferase
MQSTYEPPGLSVVLPVYCEEEGIRTALAEVYRVLGTLEESFEVVLVDDGSTDSTWRAILGLCASYPHLQAYQLSRNFGKEAAVAAGLARARGRAVIVMDADLQHPPDLIPQMVAAWREGGAEVVEARKVNRGRESLVHRAGATAFYLTMNRLTGFDLAGASDFKLLDRRVVDAWHLLEERGLFFRGNVAWLGFSRHAIPFSVPPRRDGASKWSIRSLIRLFSDAVTTFSALPLQIVTLAGVVFMGIATVIGARALHQWFIGEAVEGFTTVILLLLIVGGVTMLSLGLIGVYIARLFEEVKRRPRYVVRDAVGASGPAPGLGRSPVRLATDHP